MDKIIEHLQEGINSPKSSIAYREDCKKALTFIANGILREHLIKDTEKARAKDEDKDEIPF